MNAPSVSAQPSVRIRLATTGDAAAMARVLRESFDEFQGRYTPQGFAATTPDEHNICSRMEEGLAWLAVSDDAIVGTASAVKKPGSSDVIVGTASAVKKPGSAEYARGMAVISAADQPGNAVYVRGMAVIPAAKKPDRAPYIRGMGGIPAAKKPGSVLYIRGMAVIPAARGHNIGRMLLETIEAYALAQGCTQLRLCTAPFLFAAIRLYERFGFRFIADGPNDLFGTPLLSMGKPLGGESEFYEVHRKEQLCRKIMDTLLTGTSASA